jgi:hypothetical protein
MFDQRFLPGEMREVLLARKIGFLRSGTEIHKAPKVEIGAFTGPWR